MSGRYMEHVHSSKLLRLPPLVEKRDENIVKLVETALTSLWSYQYCSTHRFVVMIWFLRF